MLKRRKLSHKLYSQFGVMIVLTALMSVSTLFSLKREHALSSVTKRSQITQSNIEKAASLQSELREKRLTGTNAEKKALIKSWNATYATVTSEMLALQEAKGVPQEACESAKSIAVHSASYEALFRDFISILEGASTAVADCTSSETELASVLVQLEAHVTEAIKGATTIEEYQRLSTIYEAFSKFAISLQTQQVEASRTQIKVNLGQVGRFRQSMKDCRKAGNGFRQTIIGRSKMVEAYDELLIINQSYQRQFSDYLRLNREYIDNFKVMEKNKESLYRELEVFSEIINQKKDQIESTTMLTTNGLFALLVVVGLLFAFTSVRSTVGPLHAVINKLTTGAAQLVNASGEVSSASQALAEGATEQAAGLEESSASLSEVTAMTRQNADNATQAHTLATEARNHASTGTEAMERMGSAINDIKQSADETAKIIKVIDGIAFQTNLLALNASVEAARAGEAGKGFAVVAEEVRNLAMRSAEASRNTANLIQESVAKAQNGVKIASQVDSALSQIVDSVSKTSDLVNEIAEASKEQANGIDQISTAIEQMEGITQQNAASAEESASASGEMSMLSDDISLIVTDLECIIDGGVSSSSSSSSSSVLAPLPVEVMNTMDTDFEENDNHSSNSAMAFESENEFGMDHFEQPEKSITVSASAADLIPFDDEISDFND